MSGGGGGRDSRERVTRRRLLELVYHKYLLCWGGLEKARPRTDSMISPLKDTGGQRTEGVFILTQCYTDHSVFKDWFSFCEFNRALWCAPPHHLQ